MEYIDLVTKEVFGLWGLMQRFSQTSNPDNMSDYEMENNDPNSEGYIPRSPNNPIARLETTYPQIDHNFYYQGNAILDETVRPVQRTYEVLELPVETIKQNLIQAAASKFEQKRTDPLIFNGNTYDLDDQFRVLKQMNMIWFTADPNKNVYLNNNQHVFIELNEQDVTAFGQLLLSSARDIYAFYKNVDDQIAAATTIQDFQAINMDMPTT